MRILEKDDNKILCFSFRFNGPPPFRLAVKIFIMRIN